MSRLPFAAPTPVSVQSFRHEAFLYDGREQFLSGTTAFVRGGLDAGEAVLVAVVEARARLLRDALGPDADRVEFLDMAEVGRNPARIIPAWQDWIDRQASGKRGFRGVGEPVWAGRTPSEIAECRLHEQLLNTAFDGGPGWWLLCPYDVGALPASVAEGVYGSHPDVVVGDTRTHSLSYPAPAGVPGVQGLLGAPGLPAVPREELEDPQGPVCEVAFDLAGLAELRDRVARFAEPVAGARGAADAVLVVSELAANSIKYGGGAGTLRLWREAAAVVCEVRDGGVITDPLAGRRRPSVTGGGGKAGLWIANQVCDLVQIRSAPGRGTVVRARLGTAGRTPTVV